MKNDQNMQRLKMILGFALAVLLVASVVLLRALGKPFADTLEIGLLGSALGAGMLGGHGALKTMPGGDQ